MSKDYYKILGVKENASQDEIKKIYRNLSKKYHPDVNPEGKDMFQSIAEAYEVIGDPKKREQYDYNRKNPFGGGNINFGDFFDIFNQGSNPFSQRRNQRAPDKIISLNLTAVESYKGVTKKINYQKKESCGTCGGQGGDRVTCVTCQGRGVIQQQFNFGGSVHIQNMNCPSCKSNGFVLSRVCHDCSGTSFKTILNTINIDIPKSVDEGDFLRIPNAGDYIPNVGVGDLVIQIKIINDGQFQKVAQNLYMTIKLPPESLFLKEDLKISHPDGDLMVKFPNNFNTGTPIRLRGKGFTINDTIGDFIIKFDIDSSISKLSEEKIKIVSDVLKQ